MQLLGRHRYALAMTPARSPQPALAKPLKADLGRRNSLRFFGCPDAGLVGMPKRSLRVPCPLKRWPSATSLLAVLLWRPASVPQPSFKLPFSRCPEHENCSWCYQARVLARGPRCRVRQGTRTAGGLIQKLALSHRYDILSTGYRPGNGAALRRRPWSQPCGIQGLARPQGLGRSDMVHQFTRSPDRRRTRTTFLMVRLRANGGRDQVETFGAVLLLDSDALGKRDFLGRADVVSQT